MGNKEKKTVQDLILERIDKMSDKLDVLTTETVPAILTAIAVAETKAKTEAKTAARFHGAIWGGLTVLVSIVGVAFSYFHR